MSTGGVVTDVTQAIIRQRATMLEGVILTQPALLVTDGKSSQYACDVQISLLTSDGRHNQTKLELEGVPGGINYNVSETTTVGTIMRNVPVVNNNASMIYATIGTGVVMTKTSAGRWQITGLTMRLNGTQFRYGVTLQKMTLGAVTPPPVTNEVTTNLTLVVRPLYLSELLAYGGGFGVVPLGQSAIFVGGVFQRLHS
jgi:hypothetical protein